MGAKLRGAVNQVRGEETWHWLEVAGSRNLRLKNEVNLTEPQSQVPSRGLDGQSQEHGRQAASPAVTGLVSQGLALGRRLTRSAGCYRAERSRLAPLKIRPDGRPLEGYCSVTPDLTSTGLLEGANCVIRAAKHRALELPEQAEA